MVECVGIWLKDLPDRMDHQTRLLPYLLAGVCDDSTIVQEKAFEYLELLGIQYVGGRGRLLPARARSLRSHGS